MSFINFWALFLFVPIFILYKRESKEIDKDKKRQKSLLYLALFFMLLALSRPAIPNALNKQNFNAQDYIIAIDASYSMQADDLKPTRYDAAKKSIKEILNSSNNNRFTIFAFTSNAMLLSPPTTDTALSIIALDSLNPKYILTKGTSLYKLLKTISKTSKERKKVIIFSDGGEDYNLIRLVNISKDNNIIPFVVATGSSNGAILKKDNKIIKDEQNNIVISKINPILKDFAYQSGGKYYELSSTKSIVVDKIVSDITSGDEENKKINIEVMSYTELYSVPLFMAIILFFIAITKTMQLLPLSVLIFLPYQAHSDIFDFYHLNNAYNSYKLKEYENSIKEFKKTTPSVGSYYNIGVSYYQTKQYRKAIEFFSQIRSVDPEIKQKLYYNMGNCAVKLKKYNRAKIYYRQALAFGMDEDSLHNLTLLYKLDPQDKKDVSKMLAKKSSKKKEKEKTTDKKDKSSSSSSNSNQKAGESSKGSASNKSQKSKKIVLKNNKTNESKFKLGYKAYELINKGFTDEKHPW